ncbi:MAG: type I restriction enzyme HsdR N-terminal domain-containing protein [Bacteroidetes bacterium]|nr:type I restriction enzyme HsdR N-terminal domain-containing protein [Bacteroidota bacterium]
MQALNLPAYEMKVKEEEGRRMIFDPVRKKYVALTPEEWVRQNFLQYLIRGKKYPATLLRVEASFRIHGLSLRADILASDPQGQPLMIVECKAPDVKITQEVFDQAARYNMKWQSPYLTVTNGISHFCSRIFIREERIEFLQDIPSYMDLRI